MKPLSWAMARLVLIELIVFAVCLLLYQLIPYHTIGEYLVVDALYYFKRSIRILSVAMLASAAICWVKNLRCPYCGLGYAMPWWGRRQKHFCAKCGREITFDDVTK